ncbi:MAG: TIGR02996 domain-containing protein [Myxococcales bacterium]|nr:TIGR02996 domain-containing protein [Myxococcales bacterium]
MSDHVHAELLASIRSAPDDDDVRLVLADAYEDAGQLDRANLIRSQVEHARLDPTDPERVRLELEARAALEGNEEAWRARELPAIEGVRWGAFRRGLVDRAAIEDVKTLAEHGDALRGSGPLRSLVIHWPRLDARPELAPIETLRELTVVGALLQPDDAGWLARSPLLSTVRELNLVNSRITVDGLAQLLTSPHLAQLEALRLPNHHFTNDGVERLVDADLPNLVDLDLSVATQDELGSGGRYEPTIDQEGIGRLVAWPVLSQLRALGISGNQIRRDGLARLLGSGKLAKLETLRVRSLCDYVWDEDEDYDDMPGRPDTLAAFADMSGGVALRELDLGENELSDTTVRTLSESPALASLEVLRMDYPGPGYEALLQAPWLDSVRILSATDGSGLFAALVRRAPARLHTLDLSSRYYWSQNAAFLEPLEACAPLEALRSLDLSATGLGDAALRVLAETTALPSLLALYVDEAQEEWRRRDQTFSLAAASELADSPLGARLRSLEIGLAGFDRLRRPDPVALSTDYGGYTGPLAFL